MLEDYKVADNQLLNQILLVVLCQLTISFSNDYIGINRALLKKGNKNMGMANHHGCSYPLMSIMIYSITIINPVYFSFL